MILDTLEQAGFYTTLHGGFSLAFRYLHETDFSTLQDGKYVIDEERVFALVSHDQARGRDASPLEAHREFIDIQYVVSGEEVIGWRPTEQCRKVRSRYLPEEDIALYDDLPDTWIRVPPGSLMILFPDDAHAPLAGEGSVHKVVIKVAVNERWRNRLVV